MAANQAIPDRTTISDHGAEMFPCITQVQIPGFWWRSLSPSAADLYGQPTRDDSSVQLFEGAHGVATALIKTTLAALGLRERQHLQEWVISNLVVMGDNLLIITSEYDSWRGADGITSQDRLDVLALEPPGRLVVGALKRNEDRDVHLQPINYAQLGSRFDLDTLAEAHAKFRTFRGDPIIKDTARERLLKHVEEFDPETLRTPSDRADRSQLAADSQPHGAVWLSEMGLDVSLVLGGGLAGRAPGHHQLRTALLRAGARGVHPCSRQAGGCGRKGPSGRTHPAAVAAWTDSSLGIAASRHPTGHPPVHARLTRGTTSDPDLGPRPAVAEGRFGQQRPGAALTWEADGTRWSPTGLAKHLVEQATAPTCYQRTALVGDQRGG